MKKEISNNSSHKCVYCYEWSSSPIIRRWSDQDQSSRKVISRKCPVTKKQINIDSNGCKYFSPSLVFYCDKNQCFIDFMVCLNRRRNQKGLDSFNQCKKCRQFEKDVKSIIEDYWLNGKEIIIHRISIKRRDKIETKRPIKRREKKIKKIIKRRPIKRTIKRRR